MNALKGLNLGGSDKDPATPPSGPSEQTPPEQPPEQTQESEQEQEPEQEPEPPVESAPEPAPEPTSSDEPAARWTTHPIMRYTVGDYTFRDGLLVLQTPEQAEAFQKVHDSLPVYEQMRIKKIDLSAAEALVRERLAAGSGVTKGIDSSTGERAPSAAIGTGSLTGE